MSLDSRYCEVLLETEKGYEYQGVYLLMETAARGENRVDIDPVSYTHLAQIYDTYHEKTIYSKTFSRELGRTLFQEALNRGLHIQSYSDGEVLALEENKELLFYMSGTTVSYKICLLYTSRCV